MSINNLQLVPENWHENFIPNLAKVLQPNIYVELGLYHCELFNSIIPFANELYGVDINSESGSYMQKSDKAQFFNGTTSEFLEIVRSKNLLIDLLFIDADHSCDSVLEDFWNYFPYVKEQGIILLHDTHPKNIQYTDKGYCGDGYRAIEKLKGHEEEFELMTIPVHPGITLIRKRRFQLSWQNDTGALLDKNRFDYDKNVRKSIPMEAFVSKIKQMFPSENEILNIVEIGALDAQDSVFFKENFPGANVYAIEALQENYERYLKKLENINTINAVVSNIDGEVDFYKKNINGIHSIYNRGNEYGNEIIKVKSIRFDTLAAKYKIKGADVVKIDVEGATLEVLEGMGDFLSKVKIMHLESESYPFFEGQKLHEEVVNYLEGKGFTLLELTSFPIQKDRFQYDSIWVNNNIVESAKNEEIQISNSPKYRIVCITQIYNELRKENLERFWNYIKPVVDGLIVYDDGSTDGSYEYMLDKAIFVLKGGDNNFKDEVNHKKVLLEQALLLQPDFILWLDADEVLTANAAEELQNLCNYAVENEIDGILFHEINLWRSNSWQRLDNSYDEGWFVRLWRVTPGISYDLTNPGLHQQQYPHTIKKTEKTDLVSVIHYGFASDRSLAFKYLVYRKHGQTGWALERLLNEDTLALQKIPAEIFPAGLFIDDQIPEKRSFNDAVRSLEPYRDEVLKPRVSIVCLIYKSVDWLEFIYKQVLKYCDLSDKEFFFVANDASDEVLNYLNDNYIPHYVWNNSEEQKNEWFINNVYRAWNFSAQKAKGDYILFINSDMAFTPGWFENLFNKLDGNNCITSRLVESGKLLSGTYGISKNFGKSYSEYNESSFIEFAESVSEDKIADSGLFMPLLIKRNLFLQVGGYPEGNIVPGSDIFRPVIAKKNDPCISGDVVMMQKLSSINILHQTAFDSIVYHFQCGEMDEKIEIKDREKTDSVIVANDYIMGRMGEKTMWGFLLENLPCSTGVDLDIIGGDLQNFSANARNYIQNNLPGSSILIQNASFIDILNEDKFTICYLQDNLRAMSRKSAQQEVNLRHANLLVTNSRETAVSYPEYNFEIIPIGVDDKLFRPLEKSGLRKQFNFPDKRTGIFVGDFSEVKGWQKVKSVIDNHPEIFWILVSKDDNRYILENCVTYNRINQELLSKLLNCADFFILGSPVETQCLAAIEACLCNLPVIMRNTGIFADLTNEERNLTGYFGDDFEEGLVKVAAGKFNSRQIMTDNELTINGMTNKWKKLLSQALLSVRKDFEEKTSGENNLTSVYKQDPEFSVIVPTYNQAAYIGEALDSLLAQNFKNWEAVIINDGSTDNTSEVIAKYAAQDKRFKYYYKENGGVASALNLGIKNAKGNWICWLSSDDMFEPEKLEIMFEEIQKNPQIKFFYTHFYYLNDKTKEKTSPDLWNEIPGEQLQVTKFFTGNYVHGNSFVAHSEVFKTTGGFDETLRQAQDFDMWLRISAQYLTKYINKRTCTTRLHEGQDTNAFPDGMYYDSARSCLEFINTHKYEDFYPWLNLNNEKHLKKAVEDTLIVALNTNAFMYRCGYMPALLDRFNEWLKQRPKDNLTEELKSAVRDLLNQYNGKLPAELIKAMERICSNNSFTYRKYDLYDQMITHISKLIAEGYQDEAAKLDRYIQILFTKRETQNLPFVLKEKTYKSRLYIGSSEDSYKVLPFNCLTEWELSPVTYQGLFKYKIGAKCPNCSGEIISLGNFTVKTEEQEFKFACSHCLSGYKITDGQIGQYLLQLAPKENHSSAAGNKIAFIARGLNGKSGGTIIVTKYMHWLEKLGCNITTYSDSPKGDWADIPGKFIVVKNFRDADLNGFDYVFLYSVLDLGKIINKVTPEKIIYVCQAYEGFLYGDSYETLRTDKPMFHSLHSLPIKIIVVSKHLREFFKTSFNKETYLVPNFIDPGVFHPLSNIPKDKSTILFVGNPVQPLKGLDFLLRTIKTIQNSTYRVEGLKLIIAVGVTTKSIKENFKKINTIIDCKVDFFSDLDSQGMAELINSSTVYTCCSWYEGFSLSVLEAMACGTPVITTKNMGAQSFCVDGVNSYLINYGDVVAFAKLLLTIFSGSLNPEIINNALKTAVEHNELNSLTSFYDVISNLELNIINSSQHLSGSKVEAKTGETERLRNKNRNVKLKITYLVTNINALTGGNITLLNQANELINRGHEVTIISFSKEPFWFKLKAKVITIANTEEMYKYAPVSDIVIATYFQNAIELEKITAPVKIYFAQGDQFIFEDSKIQSALKTSAILQDYMSCSSKAYLLNNVKLILNSNSFAKLVYQKTGRQADGIVKVGVDNSVFRPLEKQAKGFKLRILLVGPDTLGSTEEPLDFKGIGEAKEAITRLKKEFNNFTLVRISNTEPGIFKNYNCEFYINPDNQLKTFLYGTADILIYPSHYESWGLPPLEAMAAKTAVVCTANTGSDDYCIDKVNCLLIPAKSPDAIYKALKQLLTDEQLREKIADGGYLTARKYTKENEWNKLEDLFYSFYEEKMGTREAPTENPDNYEKKITEHVNNINELIKSGNYDKASDIIRELLASLTEAEINNSGFSYTNLLNLAGNISLLKNELDIAQNYFEIALNTDPKSSLACTGLGEVFFKLEQFESAKMMYEWGIKYNSENIIASEGLKKVNLLMGITDNEKELNSKPEIETEFSTLLDKAYSLFGDKKFKEVLEILTIAEKLLPEKDMKIRSALESLRGFSYLGLNNYLSAKYFFERALYDEPDSSDACAGLGEVFFLTGFESEAKTMFEWAVAYNPGNKFAKAGLCKVNCVLGYEEYHNTLAREYN